MPWWATKDRMKCVNRVIDNFLTREYSAVRGDLGIYRIAYCLVILAGLPESPWLGRLPAFMFAPPLSPVALWTAFPAPCTYDILNHLIGVTTLCVLLGVAPRVSGILLSLALIGMRSFAYASGKINHDILVPLIPAVFACSHWADVFRITGSADPEAAQREEEAFPVAIFAFLSAFWMASAGLQKLVTGWLDPSYSVVHTDVVKNYYVSGRMSAAAVFALAYTPNWLWEVADWGTIVFELSGIVCVWRWRWFRCWLAVAPFFHLGIELLMRIPYAPAVIAYGAFVPWTQVPVVSWFVSVLKRHRMALLGVLAVGLALRGVATYLDYDRAIIWLGGVIAAYCVVAQLSQVHFAKTQPYEDDPAL